MTSEENDAIMKERQRARKRKVNMTDEQIDAHRARNRVGYMTPEQNDAHRARPGICSRT